ncbi:MAG: alpha/beta fold hydrolase [Anaerolineaceae bacterium]|nr:alpha/beta fold hydrolase [Anaerolineaceae bacterium]
MILLRKVWTPVLVGVLLSGLSLLSVSTAQAQSENTGAIFEPDACPFQQVSQYPIDCGWLIVPEDYAKPDGTHIRLAVATIHSLNPEKATDPVVYVAGGPGGAFVKTAPLLIYQFGLAALLSERDIVVLDQRGAGLSQPSIQCRTFSSFVDFMQQTNAAIFPPPEYVDVLGACRDKWLSDGINPSLYTAQQNAADFNALREAMGYSAVNLYGTSFGTRVALMALRDHSQGIRSVILDSTLPPQVNPLEATAAIFDRAFGTLEQRCANDFICNAAYPNLRETYLKTFQQLKELSPSVIVSGKQFTISAKLFEEAVSGQLINATSIETLPGFIYSVASGDYSAFSADLEPKLRAAPEQMPDVGLLITMACPEHLTTNIERIRTALDEYPEAFRNPDPFSGENGYRLCQMAGKTGSAASSPAVSDVPVLLLAGQFDPLTPPEWAHLAAETLSHSRIYEFPNMGHVVSSDLCAQTIMASFIRNPTELPNSTCLASVTSPAFTLTITATRLPITISAVVLGMIALSGIASGVQIYLHNFRKIALVETFRKLGWTPWAFSIGGVTLTIVAGQLSLLGKAHSVNALQFVIPLIMAVQTAIIFSPDDEPGLEVLLALPRPISWLVMERYVALLLIQITVSIIGTAFILILQPNQDILIVLIGWFASALFLSGISLYVTLRTRVPTLGMVVAIFLWMVFALFSSLFLPGKGFPYPLNAVQPFLWGIHLHASNADLATSDYWLNRVVLASTGIGLLMLALRQIADPEQVLSQQKRRKQHSPSTQETQSIVPHTAISVVQQISLPVPASIRDYVPAKIINIALYECRMQWQRPGFKVLTLAAGLGTSLLLAVLGNNLAKLIPSIPPLDTLPANQAQLIQGLIPVLLGAGFLIVIMTVVLPLLTADVFATERQQRISELMESLPVSKAATLLGKVMGIWIAAIISLFASTVIIAAVWRIIGGIFDLYPLIDLVLVGVLPLILFNTSLSVLIGATQPTRRSALLAVFGVLIITSAISLLSSGLLPSQWHVLNYYLEGALNGMVNLPPMQPMSIFSTVAEMMSLVWGAAAMAIVFFVVLYQQRRLS